MKESFINTEIEPRQSYVITQDVSPLVETMCAYKGWQPPGEDTFRAVNRLTAGAVTNAFRDARIVTLDAAEIARRVDQAAWRSRERTGRPVVSMDMLYGIGAADVVLNTTRGMSRDGKISEIARPGYPTLGTQAEALSRTLGYDTEIILTDSGAYTGGSLLSTIRTLGDYGIRVREVVFGLATSMAEDVLSRNGIEPVVIQRMQNQIDWIEQRDFVPFTPLSGRVVSDTPMVDGISAAVPYILPDGDPADWASIPSSSVRAVSLSGWRAADSIWADIERRNGLTVRVADIANLPVRVSYPGWTVPDGAAEYAIRDVIAATMNAMTVAR